MSAAPAPLRVIASAAPTDADEANKRMIAACLTVGLTPTFSVGFDHVTGFELTTTTSSDDGRETICRRIEASLMPCPPEGIRVAIAKLRAGTIASGGDDDVVMRLQLIADRLKSYPSDIVATACAQQRAASKFLPTEAEIVERCERLVRPRYLALHALRRPLPPPPEPARPAPTEADKTYVTDACERIRAILCAGGRGTLAKPHRPAAWLEYEDELDARLGSPSGQAQQPNRHHVASTD